MTTSPNPALAKLHDYYQPPPPGWTPQTIGWYILFALIGLAILWFIIHLIRRWLANRYRREALRELPHLAPDQISALLKRTALAAWPREQVASLSGDAWLEFLNKASTHKLFITAPGSAIEDFALHQQAPSDEDEHTLRTLAAEWIRRHRVQA